MNPLGWFSFVLLCAAAMMTVRRLPLGRSVDVWVAGLVLLFSGIGFTAQLLSGPSHPAFSLFCGSNSSDP